MGDTEKRFLRYLELKKLKYDYDSVKNITFKSFKKEKENKIKNGNMYKISIYKNKDRFIKVVATVREKLGDEAFVYDPDMITFEKVDKKNYKQYTGGR